MRGSRRRSTSRKSARSRNCAGCGGAVSTGSRPEPVEGHRAGNHPRAGGGQRAQGEPRLRTAPADDQTPAFFEETVRRQVESLEKEMVALESEAKELAK